jgi:hypothetical protein
MRALALFLFALCLSLPAVAERKQTFGEMEVHYSAFNSSFLQPEIAAAAGLVRSKQQGVLNIAVRKAGEASSARVNATVKNLLGRVTTLEFRQIIDGDAIYYLAQFPIEHQEMLLFSVTVQTDNAPAQRFSFNQEVFPDL